MHPFLVLCLVPLQIHIHGWGWGWGWGASYPVLELGRLLPLPAKGTSQICRAGSPQYLQVIISPQILIEHLIRTGSRGGDRPFPSRI